MYITKRIPIGSYKIHSVFFLTTLGMNLSNKKYSETITNAEIVIYLKKFPASSVAFILLILFTLHRTEAVFQRPVAEAMISVNIAEHVRG